MKFVRMLFLTALTALCVLPAGVRAENSEDRAAAAAAEAEKLYGNAQTPFSRTDPEFAAIRDRLIHGQIARRGSLNDEQRQLVTLVTLAALGAEQSVARQTEACLNAGVTPLAVREAVYHVTPYIGMARAETALAAVDRIFLEKGLTLPLENQGTVSEETRFKDGLDVQAGIFGEGRRTRFARIPEGQKDILADYLTSWCFGDTYTRKGLDLKMRELLSFAAIASLGGCDPQVTAHVTGNLAVGNSKQLLVDTLAQCLPYIGFPRTLNALACINAAAAE